MRHVIKRVKICDIPVDVLTMQETIDLIDDAITRRLRVQHCAINAAKLVHALKDDHLKKSISESDIVNADGKAIVWASSFLNKPLPERVAGIDLMHELVELAAKKKYRIFFLGAKQDIVEKVVQKYSDIHGEGIVAGFRDGYFKAEEEASVAKLIAKSRADILFVAMSSPKKEIFLNTYKSVLNVPFIMGVGGSFDVAAGHVKRAPMWMQKSGLEWLFRVIQEPRRMWKRYLTTNSAFIYIILKEKLWPTRSVTKRSFVSGPNYVAKEAETITQRAD